MKASVKKGICKRLLAGAMAAVTAFSLSACGDGGKQDKEGVGQEVREFTYVPEYISLEDSENIRLYSAKLLGDSLYYDNTEYDESTSYSTRYINQYSLTEGKVVNSVKVGEGEGYTNEFQVTSDGSIYVASSSYTIDADGNYTENGVMLSAYDSQGNVLWEQSLADLMGENSYINGMALDGEKRLYLAADQNLYLLSAEGELQGEVSLENVDWISSIGAGKDGKVYVSYFDRSTEEGGTVLAEVDYNGKKLGQVYRNYPNGNDKLVPGTDHDFLVKSSDAVYGYDLATQSYEELFYWLDSDINGYFVDNMSVTEDGRIVALMNDWNTNKSEIAYLTKTKTADLPQKKQIVIGTLTGGQELLFAAVDFNKQSTDCHITIKSYMDVNDWSETSYQDAITAMNNAITSGNCPDIIALNSISVEQLANKGVFEDLTPFLEQSSKLEKDDYLENVLAACTYSGVLVGIPKTFSLSTLAGKTSEVGEEPGWTLKEMIAFANEHPGSALLDYADKSSMLSACLSLLQDSFIDWNAGTCDFTSEEFKELLEFVASFPDEFDWQNNEISTPTKLQTGAVLLNSVSVDRVRDLQMELAMFGEEATLIGYPTVDGSNGCVMQPGSLYAISAKSQNKEVAWSFIEYYLTAESNMFSWGLPSRKSEIEKQIEEDSTPQYVTDMDGNPVLDEDGNPIVQGLGGMGWDDWEYEYHYATEEEIALFRMLLENAKPLVTMDETILGFITEDAQPYFQGQKSVDKVMDEIQNRVQLYMNENR